ncbi:MAG: hypothetical protein ABJF04_09355 [Reichenbachiella sp.]|uniref:hypothetical protein n=1 Tax=Reichenbachiella sp. TaxID=2184521 RepID=UPI003264A2D8
MEEKITYDVKAVLEKYMPSFLKLLGSNHIPWMKISVKLQLHIEELKKELLENPKALVCDATFFSVLKSKLKGDGLGDAQFDFYNQLFTDLHQILSPKERKLLGGILKSVLIQLEKDYLHFIGELSALYFYKINTNFELLKVEEKLFDHRKISADFKFVNPETNNIYLLEVLNIHLEHRENLSTETLDKIITSKLDLKLKSKEAASKKNMSLQPLIWCKDINQIKLVYNYYKSCSIPEQTHKPLGYLSFKTPDGNLYHRVNFMDEILNDYDSFIFEK